MFGVKSRYYLNWVRNTSKWSIIPFIGEIMILTKRSFDR